MNNAKLRLLEECELINTLNKKVPDEGGIAYFSKRQLSTVMPIRQLTEQMRKIKRIKPKYA